MPGMSSIEISGTTTMYTYETYPKELYPTVLLKKTHTAGISHPKILSLP